MDIIVIFVVSRGSIFACLLEFSGTRLTEDKALGMAGVMFGHLPLAVIGLALQITLQGPGRM